MRKEYDFSDAKKRPDVARSLGAKKAVTMRLDEQVVDYFRDLAKETGDPYQTLINSFLRHCVQKKMKPTGDWSFNSGVSLSSGKGKTTKAKRPAARKSAKTKRPAAKKSTKKKSSGAR